MRGATLVINPLTFSQERLWLLDRLEPGCPVYHLCCPLRFEGHLEAPLLEHRLGVVVRRHAALRTTFMSGDGRPQQRVALPGTFRLPVADLSGLANVDRETLVAAFLRAELTTPFDLEEGPLYRARLLRLGPTRHVLLQSVHQTVADEESLGLLLRELTALLGTSSQSELPKLPLRCADLARRQRNAIGSKRWQRQLAYWRHQLAGAPALLELPVDRPRPAIPSYRGGKVNRHLSRPVSGAFKALGQACGASLSTALLAAFKVLLFRLTSQTDLVVGSPTAGRNPAGSKGIIGPWRNFLALRTRLDPDASFVELLSRVGDVTAAANAHRAVPFEVLLEELRPERSLSRSPVFQVLFNLREEPSRPCQLPGLRIDPLPLPVVTSRFDLTLEVTASDGGLDFALIFNADLFDPPRMAEMVAQYAGLLVQIVVDPQTPIGDYSLVTAAASEILPLPTAQLSARWEGTIHAGFARQAERFPDRAAIRDPGATWSYAELDRRSNQLAHYLLAHGVPPHAVVAVWAHRNASLVWALLATLKAGAVFVILDPTCPAARLREYLRQTRPRGWLEVAGAQQPPAEILAEVEALGCCRLRLPRQSAADEFLADQPAIDPGVLIGPDDLAYVAFTSGSTGRPRGILGRHGPLTHFLPWLRETFGFNRDDRHSLLSPLAHDPLHRDVFMPLWYGATICIPEPEEIATAGYVADWVRRERVTILNLAPAMLRLLCPRPPPAPLDSLRYAFLVGEALTRRDAAALQAASPNVVCVNFYGTTETQRALSYLVVPREQRPELAKSILPLGRGITDVQLLVLNRADQLVGIGEPGEICFRSPHLARGYLGEDALTRERFPPNPLTDSPGDRLFRTGDLGRYLPDGNVELLGRADEQLKIRGFRVEPAEISAALARNPAVREAAVVACDREPAGRQLVAYFVPVTGAGDEDLRDFLARQLPEYMIPAHFVPLNQLPLTAHRKVDREALIGRAPADLDRHRSAPPVGLVAPRSPLEEILAGIWAAVLDRGRVGIHDNFFALGGHSLLATQVLSRLGRTLGREIPLRLLFTAPTVARLAAALESGELRRSGVAVPPLLPGDRPERIPLSFAQRRLWFLDQLEPGNPAYHLPAAWRLGGRLHVTALARSLAALVGRHEVLRTSFPSADGRPYQRIASALPTSLRVVDLSRLVEGQAAEARRLARAEAMAPFDLARGPLLRATLVRFDGDDHLFLLTLHHVVSDGWSQGLVRRELSVLYEALVRGRPSPLPALPIQYADFSLWQRRWLRGPTLEGEIAHWRRRLADLPRLELPTDRPRPAVGGHHGTVHPLTLPGELSAALQSLSLDAGASLFMTLLAAFMALLSRYTGQRDVVVGAPIANRNRADVEHLIGFFVNSLVLRGDLYGDPDFLVALKRVRETALEAYAHQDLPFEALVEALAPERDPSRHPLFQVTLAVHNVPRSEIRLAGLELRPAEYEETTVRFDLELHFWEEGGRLQGRTIYSTDLFDATTIGRLAGHYATLLGGAASDPGRRLSDLPLLSPAQGRQILGEWNDTEVRWRLPGSAGVPPARWERRRPACPPGAQAQGLHELVSAQAARTPSAVAVVDDTTALSFGELNRRADRLAAHLQALGVGPETRVGVWMDRSVELVVAFLAILKAGGAYVSVDPDHPEERVRFMLEDCQARVVLTAKSPLPPSFPLPRVGDDRRFHGDLAAYVLYTSGSTGRPKGVVISHRAIVNHMLWMRRRWPLGAADAVLQKTPLSFDASVWELWAPLLEGARLVLARPGGHREPACLVRTLREQRVSVLQVVPTLLELLLDEEEFARCGDLRRVFCGGEPLTAALHRRFLASGPGAELINLYGPTEATIDATFAAAGPAPEGRPDVPIGRPVANLRAYLLDDHLRPVPIGATGELHLAGVGLARGYLDRPRPTAERFLPSPFDERPGDRLYRTGDLARQRPDGRIEFAGRRDHQVKLRGFRIELGEIESVLCEHPAVADAVVTVRDEPPTSDPPSIPHPSPPRLVAWVTAEDEPGEPWQRDHVAAWRAVYDDLYGQSSDDQAGDFNTVGWVSSYTGQPIPEPEMRDWLDRTVERIRSLDPQRVLEIGCGTGLVLHRIAPRCRHYLATDFSPPVLAGLAAQLAERRLGQVELRCRTADDFADLRAGAFDTVILNSVVQYFPSSDYLLAVLAGAVEVTAPGGAIFLGDVRSLPLLPAFCASVELARADPSLPLAQLRERIRSRQEGEEELVIDPACFALLPQRLSRIARVRIQPKSGPFRNELTRFRYDVVLHLDGTGAGPSPETVRMDWEADRLIPEKLRRTLAERQPPALVVRGIPDRRLAGEIRLLELLAEADASATAGQLRERLRSLPAQGVEPDEVLALGRDLSYRGELSWAEGGADGRFAVLFRRSEEQGQAIREDAIPRRKPTSDGKDHDLRGLPLPPLGWTNRPLRQRLARQLEPELRRHLAARLPDHMVPAAFALVETLPLTPSGKVDRGALERRALPDADAGRPGERDDFAAPRTVTEQTLARIWSELLGRRPIGIDDNFFALGGHSLLATQVVARVRRALGVELPVRSLFEDPTVRELAARVASARHQGWQGPTRGPVARSGEHPSPPGSDPQAGLALPREFPLSFAQERLWFLQQLAPASPAFNVAAAFHFSGRLNAPALDRALSEIARRHQILRTSFPLPDGPRQRIAPASGRTLAVVDLRALAQGQGEEEARRLVDREAARPFDLTRGPPWRPLLLRAGPRQHVLVLLLHHILIDGWSQEIFYRELETLYDAFAAGAGSPLADLPLQYADFAVWQREWLRGEVLSEQLAWWKEELAGLATLPLPTDRPRPAVRSGRGTVRRFGLSPELTATLRRLSRQQDGSLFMTLLAAFMTLLYRYTGQPDVALGSPLANRQWAEIEGLIGFFVNTVVLRGYLGGDPSFRALLGRVRETALGAYAHQDAPFEKVVAALEPQRDPGSTPLFQVMFAFQNTLEQAWVPALSGLSVSRLEIAEESVQFDLTLTVWETDDRLEGALELATELFDLTTGLRLLAHLQALLAAVAAAPEKLLLALPLLAAAECQQILREWNDTAVQGFSDRSVHELFADQAAKTPDAVAVVGAGGQLTYRQLAGRAHGLANHLRRLGVGPETVVAVVMERSPEMLVAVLGILRAGGAYLPLDAADPPDRLAFMVADSSAAVLITQKRWREKLRIPAMQSVPVVFPDSANDLGDPGPRGRGRSEELAENLAYVIYTSGSAGRPKGVLVRHGSLASHTVAAGRDYSLGPADRVLQFASLSFDASAEEIFPALTRGATLVLRTDAMLHSVPEFLRAVGEQRITVLNLPTAFWHELCAALPGAGAQLPETVRLVIIGGEKAATDRLAAWRRQVDRRLRLINTYGPTEATIVASRWPAPVTGRQIGRPLANVRIHLLDRQLRPVPPGAPGIVYVAGVSLARGYLNRPRRTAASFVPNPFATRRGSRLYNSGDLARHRPDGTLEFLGRIDYQVKIRGHRIETGEIEALLRRHSRVREAAVVARDDQPGGRLVAYVTDPDGPPSVAALRRFLEQKLPAVMVPAAFIFQDKLPRTPGGKVDRQALPPPDASRPELASTYAAPASDLEEVLVAIWQEALAVDRVGVDDNFFDLGGHSLLLVRVRSRLEARLGRRLPMVDLFRYPTIRSLAQHLGEADRGAQPTQPPGAAATRLARRPAVRRHRRIRADHRAP